MPIPNYAVVKGALRLGVPFELGNKGDPHYNVIVAAGGREYRVAVNTQSQDHSDLLFLATYHFDHPIVPSLISLSEGVTPQGVRLDYFRDPALLNVHRMTPMAPSEDGPANDLNDVLADLLTTEEDTENQTTYQVVGQNYTENRPAYRPKQAVTVWAVGSLFAADSENPGVHDIHMNQGNGADHRRDNGIYTDGALFVQVGNEMRAFFAAFQSQRLGTDSKGNPVPGALPLLQQP
ncbi:uncharacterized protein YukJ [Herbaspirillum rubrisubalbicans]|uniref:DUF2278 family protein n=1 Tax=Herbaspirillum rubrisubalbicans TaxID=80842 RepID=UPI00209F4F0A|nr:DUF2278 family protein [Herbaspirillum rubrisubalbicans]MCP1572447.1 uncharacterized protein YukJ [Herbaspirillum rubrisubalbicans]